MERLPLYRVEYTEGENTGVMAVSLVDMPAVESDFIKFGKDGEIRRIDFSDEEKRRVIGCVLRADYPIYRRTDDGYEYNVIFPKDSILNLSQKMFATGSFAVNNAQHDSRNDISDKIEIAQMFIKDTAKGISPKGFKDIEDGSLFAEYHIKDDELWKEIKDGKINGFSVEINEKLVRVDEDEYRAENEVLELLNKINQKIKTKR